MNQQTPAVETKPAAETTRGSHILWSVLALSPLLMPGAAYLLAHWPYSGVAYVWLFLFLMGAFFTVILAVAFPARLLSQTDRTVRVRQTLLFVAGLLGVYWVYANASPFESARAKLFEQWSERLDQYATSQQVPEGLDAPMEIPVSDAIRKIGSSASLVPNRDGTVSVVVIVHGSTAFKRWAYIYSPDDTRDVPTNLTDEWPEIRTLNAHWFQVWD